MNWDDTTDDTAPDRLVGSVADRKDQAVEAALKSFKPTFQTSEGTLLGTEAEATALAADTTGRDTVPGYAITSWEQGYGDMEFVLDLDTIRASARLGAAHLLIVRAGASTVAEITVAGRPSNGWDSAA